MGHFKIISKAPRRSSSPRVGSSPWGPWTSVGETQLGNGKEKNAGKSRATFGVSGELEDDIQFLFSFISVCHRMSSLKSSGISGEFLKNLRELHSSHPSNGGLFYEDL